MKKRILALMGSPRPGKHTNTALELMLEEVDLQEYEVVKINLRDLNIGHCIACENCGRTGECIKKDDMTRVYEEFDRADIIILAAPIYFNSVNSLTKTMIDRCQVYWSKKYVLGDAYKRGVDRKGIFLSVGGAAFTMDQFSGSIPVIDYFFRAINADYIGNFFISNTDRINIREEKSIVDDLKYIGRNIGSLDRFSIQK